MGKEIFRENYKQWCKEKDTVSNQKRQMSFSLGGRRYPYTTNRVPFNQTLYGSSNRASKPIGLCSRTNIITNAKSCKDFTRISNDTPNGRHG